MSAISTRNRFLISLLILCYPVGMRPIILLLLTLPFVIAAPVPKAAKKAGVDGCWLLVEMNVDGEDQSIRYYEKHWVIDGETMLMGAADKHDRRTGVLAAKLTIPDPRKPHLRLLDGRPVVLEVDGDTLRMASSEKTVTECKPGPEVTLTVYARMKE